MSWSPVRYARMDDLEVPDDGSTSGVGPIFPLSRVKKIMKTDKDVHMCSADAVLLSAMAAENFLEYFSEAICKMTEQDKKKTVTYKEAANAVKADPRLEFLAPLIPQTIPVAKALELRKAVTRSLNQEACESDPEPDVSTITLQ